jgi:hypothetical protein
MSSLDATLLTLHYAPLQYVEERGFNNTFTSSEKASIIIPSSLIIAGSQAFAY